MSDETPTEVKVSFWLWVAAAVFMVAAYLSLFILRQHFIDEQVKNNVDPKATADKIASGATYFLLAMLIGAIVMGCLFVLFAWKAREGTRSARTVLTGLLIATVLFLIFIKLNGLAFLFGPLFGLIALLLMYLPKVQPYFPKVGRQLP
ncbi:hypothetical protein SAMN05421504_10636 [Amycolatopsis xylanica]|uniref:DUF4064 domain-containing protein n=1 Tax=Amycolatopsis xylanica TaxID=589385 RepID=A0A1H3L338_9PSEU|nr:hypothetical protein [Amycolatopsis xylanica]SDY58639.1 hypothetical protein SAMN05421504_10636 [Amycolatopsis xylanica]